MQTQTVPESVRRAVTGDVCAFEELYEAHRTRMFRYFYQHTSDQADSEELTQSFFVKLWRALPQFEDRGVPFVAWLYRMARNHLVDHYRSMRRRAAFSEPLETADGRRDERATIDLQRCEDSLVLTHALDALRPKQREIVVLRFYAQLNTTEIATVMGMTEGAVRVQQTRALQAMRRELDREGVTR